MCHSFLHFRLFQIYKILTLKMVLLFVCTSCTTLGPEFETPQADISDNWIDSANPKLNTEGKDIEDWWKVFNDPILDNLISSSYNQNLSLQVAGLRVLEARAQLGIAVGNLYPQRQQVRGSARYNSLSENAANTIQGDLDYWDYDSGFDIAWELDFWGKFKRGVESADARLLASMADYDDFLVTLFAEVANTYVAIRTFEKRIQLAEENVKLQKHSLRITEVRFENGATTELDVQQSKNIVT